MSDYKDISDNALFSLLLEGDDHAFTEIYNRYWSILYLYVLKFSGRNDQAEDIVQDVFISLWKRTDKAKHQTSLSGYLYTSVRYKIFDLIDHEKVRAKHLTSLAEFLDTNRIVADSALIERDLKNSIESAIQLLPSKMREVFELSRKEGMSQKEISAQLKISDKTVKKQMSKALKILRLKLGKLTSVIAF